MGDQTSMEAPRQAKRPQLTARRIRLFKELADELRGEAERRAAPVPDLFKITKQQRERRREFVKFVDRLVQWHEEKRGD